jgi:hypothetical protein
VFDSEGNQLFSWLAFLLWLSLPISFIVAPVGMWFSHRRGNPGALRWFAWLPVLHVAALIGAVTAAASL